MQLKGNARKILHYLVILIVIWQWKRGRCSINNTVYKQQNLSSFFAVVVFVVPAGIITCVHFARFELLSAYIFSPFSCSPIAIHVQVNTELCEFRAHGIVRETLLCPHSKMLNYKKFTQSQVKHWLEWIYKI